MQPLSAFSITAGRFAKARGDRYEDRLRALADAASPKLKRAIIDALRAGDAAAIKGLAAAIEAGDTARVLALLGLDALEQRFAHLQRELRSIVASAGEMTAASQVPAIVRPVGPRLVASFDVLNPRTMQFVAEYDFGLIREISEATRKGVQEIITEGLANGVNPRKTARLVRERVGLTARQQGYVSNFRRELETFHERGSASAWGLGNSKSKAPGGAGVFAIDAEGNPIDGIYHRRLRDFRYDKTLAKHLKSGKPIPPEMIDKMVDRYRDRWLNHRAETIARQESLRAANRGAFYAWKQAIDQGAVNGDALRKFWRTAGDERVRLSHRAIPNLNPEGVPVDAEFDTPTGPAFLPPFGIGCRCVVVYREV